MAAKKFQKSYFDVLGLCCSSEVPLIENILKPLDGVKDVSVIVPSRTVIVVHDNLIISQLQIVKALNQARLEANVRVYGDEENYKRKWPSPYAIACGLLLLLSLFKYIYDPFRWLALGAVAVGIFPIAWKGLVAIQNFRLDINILAIAAVIGTIVLKDYLEAGTIVFLFSIAEWLESRASHKATAVMSSLMAMAPQEAVIAETGAVVDVDEVKVNTILAVKAGKIIPIDGIVVEGKCEVDEKTLTGESFPVAKQNDSIVWAGTINLNGYISVKTTALAEDCVVAKMAKLVEEAQNNKSSTQRFIDKCAKYYTPAVFITAIGLVVIPAALRVDNENHWLRLGLVVIVSACPCALILSTPVATFCALSKAATSGLLIKGGDYLEILAKIKTMAFDKTGTITRGEFIVTDFQSLHIDVSLNSLLYWVSSIETKSSHPMAVALVDYGRSHSIEPKPENVEEFQNFPGEGIHGKIDGKDIYIGNRKISQRAGCGTVPTLEGDAKEGQTIGYIYNGATPVGIFSLSDACRSGVVDAVKELKSLGIKTVMLTGDSHAAAMHAQDQLGHALEVVHAELLPEDKARIITGFKKEGATAMIGDGMNDAPALATADIGISMGISGSALATETGHVTLMSNDIRKIPKAIKLARKCHRKVIENVILSIATKTAILALAFAGHPLVWAAVLADLGTCLLVIFNSMLLLRGTHKHGGKCCKSSTTSKHIHKKGCKSTHDGSCHSSHKNHHHSSSHNIAQKMCEPQKCSSQICASKCQSSPCSSSSQSAHHKHQHCSSHNSHNIAQRICEPQKCSSQMCASKCQSSTFISSSCENEKYTDSADRPDGCIGTGGVCHEAKPCEHGSCNMGTHDMEYSCNTIGPFVSSSCGEDKCTKLMERQGGELHEVKHCDHAHDMGSNGTITHNHLSHGHISSEQGLLQVTNKQGHCHTMHCAKNHVNDEDLGNVEETSCDFHAENRVICCENKCGTNLGGRIHASAVHNVRSCGHEESMATHSCMSLEKREFGGCCKSFRKECCGKHGHFGAANFGGSSLSEIIIE